MTQEMECICQQCGISVFLSEDLVLLEDPASTEVKLLDSLLVCQACGGQLALIGKSGDEPYYRLK